MTAPATLECIGLEKRFGGVTVLSGVSFRVPAGGILGLVGENGAGKSTLMNLLGGNLRPEAGRMLLGGEPHAPHSAADADRAGVAFVHQELNLFPNLSIAENLFLTSFPRAGAGWIDRQALRERTRVLLADVGLDLAPDTLVERLSAGQCQLVEIARALARSARLLILDEPTTSLSARETTALFALLERLRARGLAMIYISHALGDVLRLSDEIVVLRDGRVVGQGPRAEFTPERLVTLMVGRQLAQLFPARRGAAGAEPLLEVRGVSEPHQVQGVNLVVRRGEVLGIAGLMGAGRSELARMIFGLDAHAAGDVRLGGESLAGLPPAERIRRGLAFLTEDRRAEGLCLEASIADNLALVSLRDFAHTGLHLLDGSRWKAAVNRMREAVQLRSAARDDQPVQHLSGGNQQKVVLGKWLLSRPQVLILDEPTRGVDVGAKFELYQLILQLADEGSGVLVISSELEELLGLCDRILVMSRGEVTAELPRAAFDRERLLAAALPREGGAP